MSNQPPAVEVAAWVTIPAAALDAPDAETMLDSIRCHELSVTLHRLAIEDGGHGVDTIVHDEPEVESAIALAVRQHYENDDAERECREPVTLAPLAVLRSRARIVRTPPGPLASPQPAGAPRR